ncbi:MAG: precorrin-2 C(20)-methyltransferase, partial [Acidimicrobiia bacterium]|nr:precorrin-2 C(20)-methyltransferase [Acidimicrobiia bacterium]
MHKSSIYLPDELKQSVGALAARSGRSEAELIRQAIERLVALSGPGAPTSSSASLADSRPTYPAPALVGVGVGPGDPGLVTLRAQATLRCANRVLVIATDRHSVGRAEMVVRSVAPDAHVQRVAFSIGADASERRASLLALAEAVTDATDAGELVAVAVIGDPTQWTIFPDLAEVVTEARPWLPIAAEPGITSYQAAAAAAVLPLGQAGAALVVVDDVDELRRQLERASHGVVLYKASTDASEVKAAAAHHRRADAVVAELSGLPGQRLIPLADTDDGPISYLATVV